MRKRKGEQPMNKNKRERKFLKGFKSIQSTIFAAVSVLVLCAVLAATAVSVRYTNSTVYENSAIYTQTIIHQLNQNVDSYITYMDNICLLYTSPSPRDA